MKKGIIILLFIFIIIETVFLAKVYKKITILERKNSFYNLSVTDGLELEDKIWPYTSENERYLRFHPKSVLINGPIHNKVNKLMRFFYHEYTLFSCEHKKRIFPNKACRLALSDELERIFPTLVNEEKYKYPSSFKIDKVLPLTDKHLELETKAWFERDFSSTYCASSHEKEENLKNLKEKEKFCYKKCRKEHSKAECTSPL